MASVRKVIDMKIKEVSVWLEFLVIDGNNFSDGKKRATCSHWKKATFISIAQYGSSNMMKHLEKCKAYQAGKDLKKEEVRKGKHSEINQRTKKKKNSLDQMWIGQVLNVLNFSLDDLGLGFSDGSDARCGTVANATSKAGVRVCREKRHQQARKALHEKC
ncbi:hypothetical protein Cgig2_027687 [Carnegiea gigantea]|uniref:Uncharacterized protein n=1 Tax=Carnegiea gigantea TaxID=171969 RepID=A0A9Q1JNE8_9CARY|nr:hypothetical protein Cgig2_027687 [Carnegiea gigantea]